MQKQGYFVKIKEVNGKRYAYIACSKRIGNKVIQLCLKYIGKEVELMGKAFIYDPEELEALERSKLQEYIRKHPEALKPLMEKAEKLSAPVPMEEMSIEEFRRKIK